MGSRSYRQTEVDATEDQNLAFSLRDLSRAVVVGLGPTKPAPGKPHGEPHAAKQPPPDNPPAQPEGEKVGGTLVVEPGHASPVADSLFAKGAEYFNRHDFGNAVVLLRQAVKLAPITSNSVRPCVSPTSAKCNNCNRKKITRAPSFF